ncbi:multiple coagulation factor deficiency protein 2 homolog [Uloborus diversus]|uniref:multiple coagulation factor deficiency protein 2 homolog n=1 Tax=Uloborus diversus TaxID=327109 RepID=UPI0024091D8F|nr:multiple coagulation factor deficiency protein 2 homolog [Uloborus diversus]
MYSLKSMERSNCFIVYLILIICTFFCNYVICDLRNIAKGLAHPELREIRKRWGATDIVRDLEHIKQDMQRITKMQDAGQISTNEALFYFLRMHDFDDNGKLDGHELMAAMTHAMEHNTEQHDMPFEEKEELVDSFFAYDDNVDGFISYPEFRKHLSGDKENSPI